MTARAPIIALIGLRGSGKTTVGRFVAARLGVGFIDLDDRTAARMGVAHARDGIERYGLAAFRGAEADAMHDALGAGACVLALGGGTPTAPGVAEALNAARDAGVVRVVYLRALPEVLRRRLEATDVSTRPSLTGRGTLEEIDEIFAARDPLYVSLADDVIDIAAIAAEDAAARIAE